MGRVRTILFVALLVLGPLVSLSRGQPSPVSAALSTAQQRANALSHGMNLPWWFWFSGPAWDTIGTRYTRAELQGYYDAGIRGVRIPTDYYLMASSNGASSLNSTNIAKLDAAIQMCLDIGFNIIVNVHNAVPEWDGTDISDRIQSNTTFRATFVAFWENYADHLSQFSADRLVLEPLNEPIFTSNPTFWTNTIAPDLVDAIRDNAPNHTILLSGPEWSNSLQLHNFDPSVVGDTNVIYNIHFYEPFFFTHQGADWVNSTEIQSMRHVPYPSSPERVAAILPEQTNANAKDWLVGYGEERWGPDKLAQDLDAGIDWARANNVAVMVTEFGVLRTWSDPVDRAHWYRDVRLHLEDRDVPWMIWSDLNGFGFDFETGSYETRILIALGLLPGSIEKATLSTSLATVSPGQRLTASAAGFTPGTSLWFTFGGKPIGSPVSVRSDGTTSISLRIPEVVGGSRALKVFASDGIKASRTLMIKSAIRLDTYSGATGSSVRVRLYGYQARQPVTISIRQSSTQVRLVRVVVDATGTYGVTVTIPSSFVAGQATVLARSATSLLGAPFTVSGIGQSNDPGPTPSPTLTATATIAPTSTEIPTLEPTSSPTETVPVASPVAA